jgi:hypothetical protein
MSPYNPGAFAGTNQSPNSPNPDTQTLIGLLGSMMPLLLQIQSQAGPVQPGSIQAGFWQPGFHQSGPDQPSLGQSNSHPAGPEGLFGNIVPSNPMLDHQAAVNLVEDITADSLRVLSAYLETYAGQHQGLESCVPIVTQAARCFAARDYAQTFGLIWHAYRVITALRAGNPQLPPPRGLAAASFPSASATTIIH